MKIEQIRRANLQYLAKSYARIGDFYKAIGKSPTQVGQWMNPAAKTIDGKPRNIGSKSCRFIEGKLGLEPDWLDSPHWGEITNPDGAKLPTPTVPVLGWVQAGRLTVIDRQFDSEKRTPLYFARYSTTTFVLYLEGDSMVNDDTNSQYSFPAGTAVAFDTHRACKVGDFVLAKDVATQGCTFKKLSYDGNIWWLNSLNRSYPPIPLDDPEIRVVAVATGWQTGGLL